MTQATPIRSQVVGVALATLFLIGALVMPGRASALTLDSVLFAGEGRFDSLFVLAKLFGGDAPVSLGDMFILDQLFSGDTFGMLGGGGFLDRMFGGAIDPRSYVGEASIHELAFLDAERLPDGTARLYVVLDGTLPDGCTELDGISAPSVTENGVGATLYTTRPADTPCTLEVRQFEEIFTLDVPGLPDGAYTLTINGDQVPFSIPPELL